MHKRLWTIPTLLVLLLTSPAFAQDGAAASDKADPALEAMGKLTSLIGEWEGTGWMRRGPGGPGKTRSTEKVEARLDGRILIVEGLHWSQTEPDEVVHHAIGVISHDPDTAQYRFQTHLANGRSGTHEMRVEGDDILWFIETPRGTVRYTIRIENGTWKEIGEFSADGETWQEFFGMDLKKVAIP